MTFSKEAERKIDSLPWYGNVRELQHSVEKAVILTDGLVIGEKDIEGNDQAVGDNKPAQTLEEMERQLIHKTIDECQGNMSQVAQQLGISRQTLYNKIKRYGL